MLRTVQILRPGALQAKAVPRAIKARSLIAQPTLPLVQSRPLPTTIRNNAPDLQANREAMEALKQRMDVLRQTAREGGGKATTERWRAKGKGKMTARERCVASSPALCYNTS